MGVASSTAAPGLPLKYGAQGEGGSLLYIAPVPTATPPVLLAVSGSGVSQYNMLSGDRILHLPAPHVTTCSAHCGALSLLALGSSTGEVQLVHVQTLLQARVLAAPDAAAAAAGGGAAAPGSAGQPSAPPPSVTALAFLPPSTLFVGYSDGVVRSFCAATGAAGCAYPPPASSPAPPAALAVTAMALCLAPPTPSALKAGTAAPPSAPVLQLLAVGHASGMLVLHEPQPFSAAAAAAAAAAVPAAPGPGSRLSFPPPSPPLLTAPLTGLLFLRSLNCLAAYAAGCNALVLLDISKGRMVALDFAAELQSVNRGFARLSSAQWDDARGCMLVGGNDGAVYVRSIARIAGTGDMAVTLVRVAPPAVHSAAPALISCMHYHSRADVLLCGDASGLVRRLKGVVVDAARGGGGGGRGGGGEGNHTQRIREGMEGRGAAGSGGSTREDTAPAPLAPSQGEAQAGSASV